MTDMAPPSPSAATFYVTGGTLPGEASSYISRLADTELFNSLLAGECCYVLNSRQMGKSSLMVRTAQRLKAEDIQVAVLDLTAIGQNLTPEQWYDGLLMRLGRQVGLEDELEDFYQNHDRLSPLQRWQEALIQVILPIRTGPLVIFVDEIDVVRSLPFPADEFFAAIRQCYVGRADDARLRRLTFCLLGVATPAELIADPRTTPFNIGKRIELKDFTRQEAQPLAAGLEASVLLNCPTHSAKQETALPSRQAQQILDRILFWTGGHPYLTQALFKAVAETPPNRLFLRHAGADRERRLRWTGSARNASYPRALGRRTIISVLYAIVCFTALAISPLYWNSMRMCCAADESWMILRMVESNFSSSPGLSGPKADGCARAIVSTGAFSIQRGYRRICQGRRAVARSAPFGGASSGR